MDKIFLDKEHCIKTSKTDWIHNSGYECFMTRSDDYPIIVGFGFTPQESYHEFLMILELEYEEALKGKNSIYIVNNMDPVQE
jgi:hypothetical protein